MTTSVDDTLDDDYYDEFALLHENAEEWELALDTMPSVSRVECTVSPGQTLSYIKWGTDDPELVFLHGGGQNAHTWDTVALALGRNAVAIDQLGHGRSSRRDDMNYGPWKQADAVAEALATIAPHADAVVGMSLGGATTIRLAATHPEVCRKAVIVDVTPQVNDFSRSMSTLERGSVALIGGPPTYESFDEMAEAAIALSPLRPPAAVRRGVRHNAHRREDGRWMWRYDLFGPIPEGSEQWHDFTPLWDDVSAIAVPAMLVRGGVSRYVYDEDEAEMRKRLTGLRVEVVEGAGHAVQSDKPLQLVELIESFVFGRS